MTVTLPDGRQIVKRGEKAGTSAEIIVRNLSFIKAVATRGDIGLGESYIEGAWDTPDLSDFLTLCAENAAYMDQYADGGFFQRLIWRVVNVFLRANSKAGSKKNISAHYDAGNDFYALWLDHSFTYSSGIYENQADTLEQAQANKYARILDKLPAHTQNILEIGCGWGGFAEYAAAQGKYVEGVTLSREQLAYATERLGNKARLSLTDYRDIEKQYDGIVSIEMFEAVGERYWDVYFNKLAACLKPGGKAVIQTITVRDDLYAAYRKRSDFIRHHIFPGGALPSVATFKERAEKAGFAVEEVFAFGQDYARTLADWLERFEQNRARFPARYQNEKTVRSWRFYMALCEAGFRTERTDVCQIVLKAKK